MTRWPKLPLHNIPRPRPKPKPQPTRPVPPRAHAVLRDAYDRPVFEGGITLDDVSLAIQSAADAGHFEVADDIAKRYDLDVCRICAAPFASAADHRAYCDVAVCATCYLKATAVTWSTIYKLTKP